LPFNRKIPFIFEILTHICFGKNKSIRCFPLIHMIGKNKAGIFEFL